MSTSEKKTINYNGMELECIESGYWPGGVTLIARHEDGEVFAFKDALCISNGVAFLKDGNVTGEMWKRFAILPPKPAARRLTNREVQKLCDNKWRILIRNQVILQGLAVTLGDENAQCYASISKLRAPNTDEWLEPTSDLLEVAK